VSCARHRSKIHHRESKLTRALPIANATGSRSSPRARHHCGCHLPTPRFLGSNCPVGGSIRLDWIDLFLSSALFDWRSIARAARARSRMISAVFCSPVLRIMPAYLRTRIYFLLPSWREYSEMSQRLANSFSPSKHRSSWRDGVLARMVARSRGPFYLALRSFCFFAIAGARGADIPCVIVLVESRSRHFSLIKILPNWVSFRVSRRDLLSTGPDSSACLRCCPGDRKIPAAMVATLTNWGIWLWLPALVLMLRLWLAKVIISASLPAPAIPAHRSRMAGF